MATIKDSIDIDHVSFLLDYCSKEHELFKDVSNHLYQRFQIGSVEIALLVTYYIAQERKSTNGKLKPEQSIPYTETHIITKEDLKQAYYEGYMARLRRSLFEHTYTTEEAKDGKNSKTDL